MFRTAAAVLALTLIAGPALGQLSGQLLYNLQCRMCHTNPGESPPLDGVYGAEIARTDFEYSEGLRAKEGPWTDEALDAYLKSPTTFTDGGLMVTNVPSALARAAIIEHLKTLK